MTWKNQKKYSINPRDPKVMARKSKSYIAPQVNPDLDGFDIRINEFGEIVSNIDVSRLNSFLDSNVEDKKFRGIDVVRRDDETLELVPTPMLQSGNKADDKNEPFDTEK